jgi:hypothetical protein
MLQSSASAYGASLHGAILGDGFFLVHGSHKLRRVKLSIVDTSCNVDGTEGLPASTHLKACCSNFLSELIRVPSCFLCFIPTSEKLLERLRRLLGPLLKHPMSGVLKHDDRNLCRYDFGLLSQHFSQ